MIVKKSPIHGYGVFAGKDFTQDEIIEECYTILSEGKDKTLFDYYFGANDKCATLTGFGFIYNHADLPNASYYYDELTQTVVFKARHDIKKEDEIFISYGKNWFAMRNMTVKKMPLWKKLLRFRSKPIFKASIVVGAYIILIHVLNALTAPNSI